MVQPAAGVAVVQLAVGVAVVQLAVGVKEMGLVIISEPATIINGAVLKVAMFTCRKISDRLRLAVIASNPSGDSCAKSYGSCRPFCAEEIL
jgi:hypothetical protein